MEAERGKRQAPMGDMAMRGGRNRTANGPESEPNYGYGWTHVCPLGDATELPQRWHPPHRVPDVRDRRCAGTTEHRPSRGDPRRPTTELPSADPPGAARSWGSFSGSFRAAPTRGGRFRPLRLHSPRVCACLRPWRFATSDPATTTMPPTTPLSPARGEGRMCARARARLRKCVRARGASARPWLRHLRRRRGVGPRCTTLRMRALAPGSRRRPLSPACCCAQHGG